jgi:hypothetical protein
LRHNHNRSFVLRETTVRLGPAQQAFILLKSFKRFRGRHVTTLAVSGAPRTRGPSAQKGSHPDLRRKGDALGRHGS